MTANKITSANLQNQVLVTGIGWLNAAGAGLGPPGAKSAWSNTPPAVPAAVLKSLKGGSRFGRLDLFSQIGVAAVGLALQDAKLLPVQIPNAGTNPKSEPELRSIGLVGATTSSCLVTDHNFYNSIKDDPRLASPGLFVYTLATSFLGEAALRFALTGVSLALIEPRPGAAPAITTGITELLYGDEDIMVVGCCNLFRESRNPEHISGALFLVLEKAAAADRATHVYARLGCGPDAGTFYCNHQPCPDIFALGESLRG